VTLIWSWDNKKNHIKGNKDILFTDFMSKQPFGSLNMSDGVSFTIQFGPQMYLFLVSLVLEYVFIC